jgi:hypothetical protein
MTDSDRRKIRARAAPVTRDAETMSRAAERQGPGEALPTQLRVPAEQSLGLPLDDVRLHRDSGAGAFTRFTNARAAQWRNHIFVRPDLYAPEQGGGRDLLGHELVHAGQYAAFGAGAAPVSGGHEASETEARTLAPKVLGGEPGAAAPRAAPAASVNREGPPGTDEVSSQAPQVCDPDTWTPETSEQNASVDPALDAGAPDAAGPTSDTPVGSQTVDPALIDVRSLTNADLIAQAVETRQMIASFKSCGPESEAWEQLKREIDDDRKARILTGFVFLAEAKESTPAALIQLQPGAAPGVTAIVVADPATAYGPPDVTLTGPIMTLAQMDAYLNSASLMRVGGAEAEQAIGIIKSGNLKELSTIFRPAEQEQENDPWSPNYGSPIGAGTGYHRNPLRNDLAAYDPRFMMPFSDSNRVVGHFGELQSMLEPRNMFGMRATDLNTMRYTNARGVNTVGNFPAFDQSFSDAPFWDIGAEQNRFASVAAGNEDYLTYKMARMVDVFGRRPLPVASPDAGLRHMEAMGGLTNLQPGTPEFAEAQRRYLPQTMVAVPETELSAMRSALMAPGAATADTSRRTIMRTHYQEIYRSALSQAPIEIKRNGNVVFTISSLQDLASRAPSERRANNTTYNPLETLREGAAWKRGTERLSTAEYNAAMDQLGRMAAARVVSADTANELRLSADLLRGVGTPGSTATATEIWQSGSNDPDTLVRRFAGILDPATASPVDTPMTRVANPSAKEAQAHLTAVRALGPDPTIVRTSPDFQTINAEIIRNGLLSMPKGTREQLINRILSAGPSNTLELEIQAAILADNPDTDLRQFLENATGEFNMTPEELRGSAQYAEFLRRTHGENADSYFNADRLTYFQQPGVRGVAGRTPKAAGRGLFGSLAGQGVNATLDAATGRPVQPLSFSQLAVDTGVSVASEEAERAIGAYGISRIPIANPTLRGIAGKAGPGLIVQPIISLASQRYSLYQDAQRYHVSDEEYNSRMGHAAAVGVTGAVAGTAATAGTAYLIAKFTAGGAAIGAPAGGIGAVPGAVIGFIVGAIVAGGAMYAADKLLPGSEEEWHQKQAAREAEEAERRQREAAEILSRPLMEFSGGNLPLPFQQSPDMTPQEQMVIANWFIANAQAAQQNEPNACYYDPSEMVCDPNQVEELTCGP